MWSNIESQAESDAEAVFNKMDSAYNKAKTAVVDAYGTIVSSTDSWSQDAKNWFDSTF